jgi:phosphate:Na+ symporter
LLFYLGLGFLMTVLTQSSSAAIALTLTATSGGLLGLYAAGAMVIGANVGTTSTAVLSVLGATASAKRVAAAHVLFNSITGLVALILLPVMFYLVNSIAELLNVEAIPTVTLALFHTVFNVLGVVLMLPFTARLAAFLERQFTSREETRGKPRFLDKNILATPDLALNAAVLELGHLAGLTRQLCRESAGGKSQTSDRHAKDKQTKDRQAKSNPIALHVAVEQLAISIGEFVMQLQRSSIPKNVAETLPTILRSNQYFLNAAELAVEVQSLAPRLDSIDDPEMVVTKSGFTQEVDSLLTLVDPDSPNFSTEMLAQNLALLKKHYEQQKEDNLHRALEISLSVRTVSELLENNSNARRMVAQFGKGVATLVDLREQVRTGDTKNEEFHEFTDSGS